jgi:hypothetical protein
VSQKEDIEARAGAVAASILSARAERRDFGGGQQIRDFDLVLPDGKREPLEITRHIDQPALETWERTRGINPAPSLSRYWTLDIPHKAVGASGIERPFDVREFLKEVEPALRELEEAGFERFDVGLGRRDRPWHRPSRR